MLMIRGGAPAPGPKAPARLPVACRLNLIIVE